MEMEIVNKVISVLLLSMEWVKIPHFYHFWADFDLKITKNIFFTIGPSVRKFLLLTWNLVRSSALDRTRDTPNLYNNYYNNDINFRPNIKVFLSTVCRKKTSTINNHIYYKWKVVFSFLFRSFRKYFCYDKNEHREKK